MVAPGEGSKAICGGTNCEGSEAICGGSTATFSRAFENQVNNTNKVYTHESIHHFHIHVYQYLLAPASASYR